jgi:hypothetical protein
VLAGAEHRKLVVLAEQPVGDAAHVQKVLRVRPDAAEDAEDALDEERRLHEPAVGEERQIVEVADVIAFVLESRAVLAQRAHAVFDLRVSVGEDGMLRVLEIGLLPVVLEHGDPVDGFEEGEVHRAHVHRGELGLGGQRRGEALLERHALAAAGGDVENGVGLLLDARQELHEPLGGRVGLAGLGIAGVQMDDRCTGLGRGDGFGGDLIRRDRQIGGHRRGGDAAGECAGDDGFVRHGGISRH